MIVEGYFIVFEDETLLDRQNNIYEIVSRGAFDKTLEAGNDVRALFNHDTDKILGRLSNKTLELRVDETGVYGVIHLPNTQLGRDLYELIKRGDISQCSFGFNIEEEVLEKREDGAYRWRINQVDLHEVSVVTFPAYENTSIKARSKEIADRESRKLSVRKAELKQRLEMLKCLNN